MIESATEVIVARASRQEPLRPMVIWSAVAHVVVLALAVVIPAPQPEAPRTRMVISLAGGAPGPKTGGMTEIGGREIQAVAPPLPVQPVAPPPPAPAPTMSLPEPKPRPPQARREESVRTPAPTPPAPPKPSTGEEIRAGSTPVETRARGTGFGLSSAGREGAAGAVQLDVGDFCCPEYIVRMQNAIDQNWRREQGAAGAKPIIRFTILRDGTIERVAVSQSSGQFLADQAAQRAVTLTRLPPLPAEFTNPTLTVHLRFEY
jgi:TonB family protein